MSPASQVPLTCGQGCRMGPTCPDSSTPSSAARSPKHNEPGSLRAVLQAAGSPGTWTLLPLWIERLSFAEKKLELKNKKSNGNHFPPTL